jgi:hypothetical protein
MEEGTGGAGDEDSGWKWGGQEVGWVGEGPCVAGQDVMGVGRKRS